MSPRNYRGLCGTNTTPWRAHAAAGLVAGLLLALGPPPFRPCEASPPAERAATGAISESSGATVRLVPREHGTRLNDHPVALSPAQLRDILAAISVFGEPAFLGQGGEPIPIFTQDEASALAPDLASRLAEAAPDQDVAIAVEGLREAFFFAQEPVAIGGRVFYVDRRLNIIFGELHEPAGRPAGAQHPDAGHADAGQAAGKRLYPIRIGSRSGEVARHQWRIVPLAGVSFHPASDAVRADWIEIDIPATIGALRHRSVAPAAPVPEAAPGPDSEARRLRLERRLEREELTRMHRSLPEIRGDTGSAGSVQRRFRTLGELKDKGLITPEEYEKRRRTMPIDRP